MVYFYPNRGSNFILGWKIKKKKKVAKSTTVSYKRAKTKALGGAYMLKDRCHLIGLEI